MSHSTAALLFSSRGHAYSWQKAALGKFYYIVVNVEDLFWLSRPMQAALRLYWRQPVVYYKLIECFLALKKEDKSRDKNERGAGSPLWLGLGWRRSQVLAFKSCKSKQASLKVYYWSGFDATMQKVDLTFLYWMQVSWCRHPFICNARKLTATCAHLWTLILCPSSGFHRISCRQIWQGGQASSFKRGVYILSQEEGSRIGTHSSGWTEALLIGTLLRSFL